jgi:hypothetical protein
MAPQTSKDDSLTPRLHIPVVPVLIGTLAAVNIASVVFALMG